jgi:hypothetical protein
MRSCGISKLVRFRLSVTPHPYPLPALLHYPLTLVPIMLLYVHLSKIAAGPLDKTTIFLSSVVHSTSQLDRQLRGADRLESNDSS